MSGADDQSTTFQNVDVRQDVEIAVAVAVGVQTNTAHAYVRSGATLDAVGATSVGSTVAYPFLADITEGEPMNLAVTVKEDGLDGFGALLDGTLGLASNLFNVWTLSLAGDPKNASGDIFVLGASVALSFFTNESKAIVENGGADQPVREPHDCRLRSLPSRRPVGLGHGRHEDRADRCVADRPALNLSLGALIEADGGLKDQLADPVNLLRQFVNPFGVSGKRGIGPAVMYRNVKNTTVAEIQAGALGQTGASGDGLSVAANQDIFDLAIGFTGTQASDFGLSATFAVAIYDTTTRAGIGTGVTIKGGAVSVTADDTLDRFTIAGGVVRSGAGRDRHLGRLQQRHAQDVRVHRPLRPGHRSGARSERDDRRLRGRDGQGDHHRQPLQPRLRRCAARGDEPLTGNNSNTKPPTKPAANRVDVTGLFAISVAVNLLNDHRRRAPRLHGRDGGLDRPEGDRQADRTGGCHRSGVRD